MPTATFDTLHAAKALTAAGFEAEQAEAITDTIRDAFTESVATKADIAELKAELKADIAELKADMAELKAELKADMAELETRLTTDMAGLKVDMASLETRLTTDMAGLKVDMASLETRMAERFEALYKQLWLGALGIVTAIAAIVKLL